MIRKGSLALKKGGPSNGYDYSSLHLATKKRVQNSEKENDLMDVLSGIELAIKNEADGIEFYRKAKEKMFEAFMQDEKEHLELLQQIKRGAGKRKINYDQLKQKKGPRERVKRLFETVKDTVRERLETNPDELEAIKIAMDTEKEGYQLYQQLVQESGIPEEKAFFEFLADEEKQHFQVLQNTYNYLNDTGNWFLWEERGLLDGG
jgi:rubrerythrin